MAAVELLLEFASGEHCLGGIYNDNEFTAVHMGREFGTMLSAKDVGSGSGGTAERLALCIEDIPFTLNGFFFCHEC